MRWSVEPLSKNKHGGRRAVQFRAFSLFKKQIMSARQNIKNFQEEIKKERERWNKVIQCVKDEDYIKFLETYIWYLEQTPSYSESRQYMLKGFKGLNEEIQKLIS